MTTGAVADEQSLVERFFPSSVRWKFEIFSYRNAAAILSQNFPEQFSQIVRALEAFEITTAMIRMPGGNKGPIAKYVDGLFPAPGWRETRIAADLHVRLLPPKGDKAVREYIRAGYLDGHRIDDVHGKAALPAGRRPERRLPHPGPWDNAQLHSRLSSLTGRRHNREAEAAR